MRVDYHGINIYLPYYKYKKNPTGFHWRIFPFRATVLVLRGAAMAVYLYRFYLAVDLGAGS